ncbi:hypothetical protein TSACC_3685 [Terrimicrobium sacchariphilum]|uniref:Uncharacterized protein n=2 Tax=Terrimicrobium sacchariphilum TaxID=690879 RepID=A0A146GG58_TERSA|nr:hypothetical protein TSACC_3685 [Terrimicrobium sacchariphilum]
MMFFEGDGAPGGGSSAPAATLLSGGEGQQQQAEATPWVGADGAFADGWTSRLPEEFGDARDGLGKFKTVPDLAKGYRELEKTLGAKGVFVPGKDAKPEEVAAYRKAAGIPEAPDKYNVKPEQLPEGFTWPADEALKPVLEAAHRHNVSEAALRDIIGANMSLQQTATEAVAKAQLEEGTKYLREQWGGEYDANIKLALSAAKVAGVDAKTLPGFTDPQTVMAFVNLAKKISDDQFVNPGGSGAGGGKGGAAEAREIQTNPEHPKYKAYHDGDKDTHALVLSLYKQG